MNKKIKIKFVEPEFLFVNRLMIFLENRNDCPLVILQMYHATGTLERFLV